MPTTCEAFGLRIHSELHVHGALDGIAVPKDSCPIDLTIKRGVLPSDTQTSSGPYSLSNGSLLFHKRATASYLASPDANHLVVAPFPEATLEEIESLLIATALPMVLWLRGQIVLHACAAVLPGQSKAILFAGPSGSGKSTLLQHLVARGALVVAEDSTRVDLNVSAPILARLSGLPASIYLREPHSSLRAPHSFLDAPRINQSVPADQQCASAPLGAIVVLQPQTLGSPQLQRLTSLQALEVLLNNLHRPKIPALLGHMPAILTALAKLAQNTPIYSWNNSKIDPSLEANNLKHLSTLLKEDGFTEGYS